MQNKQIKIDFNTIYGIIQLLIVAIDLLKKIKRPSKKTREQVESLTAQLSEQVALLDKMA